MLKQQIQDQIEAFLKQREDIYLIQFTLSPTNDAEVVIDGDSGVSINDCLALSRQIENNVDREIEDYSLRVSSYGISNPLLYPRQYQKNKGKKIKVLTHEGNEYKGTLEQADEEGIQLSWKERVPKKIGKGKVTEKFEKEIEYKSINKANIIVTF